MAASCRGGGWRRFLALAALLSLLAQAPSSEAQPPASPPAGTSLILLGTAGGPVIRKERSQPAALLAVNGRRYLIDCGEGTVRQMAEIGLAAPDISAVFLTHLHMDHVAGLASLLAFNWINANARPMEIVGPPGTREFVDDAEAYLRIPIGIFQAMRPKPITVGEIGEGRSVDVTAPTLIYRDENVRVTAVENSHYAAQPIPPQDYGQPRAYSYRFDTADRSIVFTGDTGPSEAVVRLASRADILVSEVMDPVGMQRALEGLSEAQAAQARAHYADEHLTAEEVGRLATRARVRMVVLTHIGLIEDAEGEAGSLIESVRRHFDGAVVAGRDLDQF